MVVPALLQPLGGGKCSRDLIWSRMAPYILTSEWLVSLHQLDNVCHVGGHFEIPIFYIIGSHRLIS